MPFPFFLVIAVVGSFVIAVVLISALRKKEMLKLAERNRYDFSVKPSREILHIFGTAQCSKMKLRHVISKTDGEYTVAVFDRQDYTRGISDSERSVPRVSGLIYSPRFDLPSFQISPRIKFLERFFPEDKSPLASLVVRDFPKFAEEYRVSGSDQVVSFLKGEFLRVICDTPGLSIETTNQYVTITFTTQRISLGYPVLSKAEQLIAVIEQLLPLMKASNSPWQERSR